MNEAVKPWDALGVSKATYYRRRKTGVSETVRLRKASPKKPPPKSRHAPVSQAAPALLSQDVAARLETICRLLDDVASVVFSRPEPSPVKSHDETWAAKVDASFKTGGVIWRMQHKAEIAAREKAERDASLRYLAEEAARDAAAKAQAAAEEQARLEAEQARAAAEQEARTAAALAFLGALDAIGLAEADIEAGALQAAFYGSMPGDPLDRYEFAILNALCDDPGAVEGIFEEPLATIRHVQHLAQTSAEPDADRYRKWLKGLVAVHRRRPAAPIAAPEPAKESDRAPEAAHYAPHTIVQENKALDLDALLAQLGNVMSAPLSAPAAPVVKMPEISVPVAQPLAQLNPKSEPIPQLEPDEDTLDGVSFEDAQAFIMASLAAEGYMPADLDLDAVERAADSDEHAMTDPLGSYHRAQQAGAED